MARTVELRRHTASDGDALTLEGVRSAVEIGCRLVGTYDMLLSSGAQRATQTLACFLAGMGVRHNAGVVVDPVFRSEVEDRWLAAGRETGGGGLEAFRRVASDLVEAEGRRFGAALRQVFEALPEGGRALIVGHSPMHEVAVYGLTGTIVPPVSKGAGLLVTSDHGEYRVEAIQ
jgi:phosphohistidine phosphatase SixA